MDDRPHVFELDPAQLRDRMAAWNLPTYRADQLTQWLYHRGVADLNAMTNLSQADRKVLAHQLRMVTGRVMGHQIASDGVQKLLLDFAPTEEKESPPNGVGRSVQTECVMIPSLALPRTRKTACVSSQAGCPVGCRFCASGLGGLEANLTAGHIIEQVWRLSRLDGVGRITHVVFMGMGEPLANLEQVVRAVRMLTTAWCMGIRGRHITISTVGLPAQIRRLADADLSATLAISLHAPNDQLRQSLIPWADHVTIGQLLEAGQYYFCKTGREVTLEYVLLHKVNDRPKHAIQLAQIAQRLRSNVNLIRYNEVANLPFSRPSTSDVQRFHAILRRAGVNTHIRASRGRDISGACGQLRHRSNEHPPT